MKHVQPLLKAGRLAEMLLGKSCLFCGDSEEDSVPKQLNPVNQALDLVNRFLWESLFQVSEEQLLGKEVVVELL